MKADSEKGYFEEGLVFWEEGDGFDFNPNTIALTFHDPESVEVAYMLPSSYELRKALDAIPPELCVRKSIGWNSRLEIRRKNLVGVYTRLYGSAFDINSLPGLSGTPEEIVEINGWWD